MWEMKGQEGTEEQAEARGRCFGKHQEHVAVRRVLEQSSPGEKSTLYRNKWQ